MKLIKLNSDVLGFVAVFMLFAWAYILLGV